MDSVVQKRKRGRPRHDHPREDLHVQVRADLNEALLNFIETADPRASKTAAVEAALREYLEARGHWPPGAPVPK